MTNTALREYHRKIEVLIENHKIDEALSHCVNIILKYPKEIETYRKLGKIFLEKQDFTTAEKVFNIVLSVFPDDFVANVGLSFVAEQDKRMDDAIKFMEYAFEIQPANESLQDELKRLYNKRDGFEPIKIKLTRGALIKMYARSNLYEQAIAEIRLGLYEKPKRVDFKLIMADMLWKSGKKIDAVETCVGIISQLPYCWTANEIMDKSFQDFNEDKKDNSYRTRLIELDPYFQYMLPTTRDIVDIPDIAIQINDELEDKADPTSFDWDNFIRKNWLITKMDINDSIESNADLNWSSILNEAIGADQTGIQVEHVAAMQPAEDSEDSIGSSSKRNLFIERIQSRSVNQGASFDQPEADDDKLSNNASDSLPNNEETSSDMKSNTDDQEADMGEEVEKPIEFPDIQDETGLVDHDAPVNADLNEKDKSIASAWVKAENNSISTEKKEKSLQDTQEIRISGKSPEEILEQALKSIEGGNYKFALKRINSLAEEDESYLEAIRDLLEKACENHPQESSLWLALGGIYQKLNLNEKALEVFIRAQKQISL